ncbi:MAG TPA: homoserine O-acetyltransferase [Acidisarcina sp.]
MTGNEDQRVNPSGSAVQAPQPSREEDFVLDGVFQLEAGGALHSPTLRFVVYGEPNATRSNVVLVCHALSGSASVAEWWPQLFTPGGLLDLRRDCVLGINILGSCYGSTGPGSTNPLTGRVYGPDFPLIGIRDIVRSQAMLLDWLQIGRLRLVLGASIGGMQALEWAILYPERVEQVVSIGVAPLGALGLGLNHLQRQAIQLDPLWKGGRYDPDLAPRQGLAIARALAVCTYKSAELFQQRFARKPDRGGEDPWACVTRDGAPSGLAGGRFDVAGYLDYQGSRFNARFDANSYLAITRTMDTFDPQQGHETAKAAYARIQAAVTLIGISSDWLFPPSDIRALAVQISDAGVRCDYRELQSSHGHDAFLAEPESLSALLQGTLRR